MAVTWADGVNANLPKRHCVETFGKKQPGLFQKKRTFVFAKTKLIEACLDENSKKICDDVPTFVVKCRLDFSLTLS